MIIQLQGRMGLEGPGARELLTSWCPGRSSKGGAGAKNAPLQVTALVTCSPNQAPLYVVPPAMSASMDKPIAVHRVCDLVTFQRLTSEHETLGDTLAVNHNSPHLHSQHSFLHICPGTSPLPRSVPVVELRDPKSQCAGSRSVRGKQGGGGGPLSVQLCACPLSASRTASLAPRRTGRLSPWTCRTKPSVPARCL